MKKSAGFNLIELMVVVVIVGILLGISIPAYQGYTLRSHRADAHSALLDIAARQERFIAQNNTHATTVAELGVSPLSREGYYAMEISNCTSGTCWTAIARARGGQRSDGECLGISYDNIGNRSSWPTYDCW